MSKSDIIEYFEGKYGEGALFRPSANKNKQYNPDDFLSSGSYRLNKILSGHHNYGIKRGRILEIKGPEGTGKTTLALHFAAEATKRKILTVFQDLEHALDLNYAYNIGIKDEYFYVTQPDCAENAYDMEWDLLQKGFKLIIKDSIPSMVPRAEVQGDMDESGGMALQARVLGKGFKREVGEISRAGAWVIYINQIRFKVGVHFGDPETTPGGNAPKFYSTYRIDIRTPRGDKIEDKIIGPANLDDVDDEDEKEEEKEDKKSKGKKKKKKKADTIEVGTYMNFKTIKNKIFPPFRKTQVKLVYGKGIDKFDDLLLFLEDAGIVTLKGRSTVIYEKKQTTRSKFREHISEKTNKKILRDKIEEFESCQ